MNFKDLTVVGVMNPKAPKKGKHVIEINPKKEYLNDFKGKEIFFAETRLTVNEFVSFFENDHVGGDKVGVYMKMINSDKIFKSQLFEENFDFEIKEIRYDENYKRILNLENMITEKSFTEDRMNHLRAQILYSQTFKQAEYLLHEGSLNLPENKVLYVNYVAGYAIHLITGCKFLEDINAEDFDAQKLKDDLAFIYKAYKLDSVWEFDQNPNIIGYYGKKNILNNNFKLFYYFRDEASTTIEGFISDSIGLQYFTGVFENEGITINTKHFTNHGMLPSRWHLVRCFFAKEMRFCFKTKTGFFTTPSGKNKSFSFEARFLG